MRALHLLAVVAAAGCMAAGAQTAMPAHAKAPRPQKFFYHYEWTRGAVLSAPEWKRGAMVQHPKQHGLPQAASGEKWREIDDNYVLASESTHAIVRVVAAPHATTPGESGGEP